MLYKKRGIIFNLNLTHPQPLYDYKTLPQIEKVYRPQLQTSFQPSTLGNNVNYEWYLSVLPKFH